MLNVLIYQLLLKEMWDQEKQHLSKFNEILAENRVRPTLLLPLWNIVGFALGECDLYSVSHLKKLILYNMLLQKNTYDLYRVPLVVEK